jgi:hypothetical protein
VNKTLGLYVYFSTHLISWKVNIKIFWLSNCAYLFQSKNLEDHIEFEHGYDKNSPSITSVSAMDIPSVY